MCLEHATVWYYLWSGSKEIFKYVLCDTLRESHELFTTLNSRFSSILKFEKSCFREQDVGSKDIFLTHFLIESVLKTVILNIKCHMEDGVLKSAKNGLK